jgi:hypothetical protein
MERRLTLPLKNNLFITHEKLEKYVSKKNKT